jgi:hypothetical protein
MGGCLWAFYWGGRATGLDPSGGAGEHIQHAHKKSWGARPAGMFCLSMQHWITHSLAHHLMHLCFLVVFSLNFLFLRARMKYFDETRGVLMH